MSGNFAIKGGGGRTPNGQCHLKFPFWFSAHLPKQNFCRSQKFSQKGQREVVCKPAAKILFDMLVWLLWLFVLFVFCVLFRPVSLCPNNIWTNFQLGCQLGGWSPAHCFCKWSVLVLTSRAAELHILENLAIISRVLLKSEAHFASFQ